MDLQVSVKLEPIADSSDDLSNINKCEQKNDVLATHQRADEGVTIKNDQEDDRSDEQKLYAGHQVKEELVIGPTEIQKQIQGSLNCTSQPLYPCDVCPRTFQRTHNLRKHKAAIHEGIKPKEPEEPEAIACGFCFKCFDSFKSLQKHMKLCLAKKNKKNKSKATGIDKVPVDSIEEELPIRKETSVKRDQSESETVENEESTDIKAFNRNERGDTNSPICKICSKRFGYWSSLTRHLKTIHNQTVDDEEKTDVNRNERGDTDSAVCKICSKRFSYWTSLTRHLKTIHNQTVDDEENTHIKVFNRSQRDSSSRAICKICFKQFTYRNSLTRHLKQVHTVSLDAISK